MNEAFGGNHNLEQTKEGIQEQNIPSFNDLESFTRENYLRNQDKQGARELAIKQINENNSLRENIETNVLSETREILDKEALTCEAKTQMYESCGISENQSDNSAFENFSKGFIDEMVIGNYDMAIEVINTRGTIIFDALKQLASWQGLKQMAEALGESIWNLFAGDAYEKGKSVAELGLITTGVGAGVYVGKKGFKLGMKEVARFKKSAERIVESQEMKGVIGDVNSRVNEIVPKKQFDFEYTTIEDISKLGDKDRIEAGKSYLGGKELTPEQEQAILKAHEVGKDREGAGIYNYNQAEITTKARILKDAGFSKEERKVLLEKGVCGKEYSNTLADSLPEDQLSQLKKLKDKLEQIDKLEDIGVPNEYSSLLLNSGFYTGKDLFKRYENLNKINGIDFQGHIDEIVEKYKGKNLSKQEAYLIFGYTDYIYYENMNKAIRNHHLPKTDSDFRELTPQQLDFISKLEVALGKLDDIKGELKVQYRGDNWEGRLNGKKKGILRAFTSSSNPATQPYWEASKVQVTVKILTEGKAKDLTDIAMIPNFGDKLRGKDGKIIGQTSQETVILPNFKYRVKEGPKEQVGKSGYWEISIEER